MGRKIRSGLTLGVSGQLSLENYELLNVLEEQAKAGDISFMKLNDSFIKNISKRKDIDLNGCFDIIAHGGEDSIEINVNGKTHEVDWRIVSNIIKRNSKINGKTIRLLSCNTGATSNGFAQNLANKLNAKVIAPTKYLWAYSNGNYFVASGIYDKTLNNIKCVHDDKGYFKTFYPKKGGKLLWNVLIVIVILKFMLKDEII